jgi:hypothetical protein
MTRHTHFVFIPYNEISLIGKILMSYALSFKFNIHFLSNFIILVIKQNKCSYKGDVNSEIKLTAFTKL